MNHGSRHKNANAGRTHRKSQNPKSSTNSAAEINRRISALVQLLEDKGVLRTGEFDDSVMNLKVQQGDQQPSSTGMEVRSKSEYRGQERRDGPDGKRGTGQERRAQAHGPAGHVSGHITSNEDGHPISGVQLILRRTLGTGRPIQFRSTKTDKQGRFVFLNLPLSREGEQKESYFYNLEARYRNKTIEDNIALKLKPGGTTTQNLKISSEISE